MLGLDDILHMDLIAVNVNNFERISSVTLHKMSPVSKKGLLKQYPGAFADTIGILHCDAHLLLDNQYHQQFCLQETDLWLRLKVKAELKRLLKLGVVSIIDEPTDLVNQIVFVEKKNSDQVRLCIDHRPLNKSLEREHYHLPTFEALLPELTGTKVFAKCGVRSSYWHVP